MSCSNQQKELKCKFPSCPCKKYVELLVESSAAGCCGMPPDIPPEPPTSERCVKHKKTKCCCTLKEIGPPYRRKRKICVENNESDLEEGETCDGNCSLSTFIISFISFIALVLIAALFFWLKMCYWTFILGLHIYHSNRSTQMAVLGLFGLLILCMCCTYAMGSSRKSSTKMTSAAVKCKGAECDASKIKDNEAREIFDKSKLYAIPMEMKQPPAVLIYLRSLIFDDE